MPDDDGGWVVRVNADTVFASLEREFSEERADRVVVELDADAAIEPRDITSLGKEHGIDVRLRRKPDA
jgi:hypothetical protein